VCQALDESEIVRLSNSKTPVGSTVNQKSLPTGTESLYGTFTKARNHMMQTDPISPKEDFAIRQMNQKFAGDLGRLGRTAFKSG
jgi:hypothetical protein